MDAVWTIGVFIWTLLVIGLMAYFALRPERPGPKCRRCDASLDPARDTCPRCKLPLST